VHPTMNHRPNLTPAYVLITVAVFSFVGVAVALLGGYVQIATPARNLLIVAAFGLTVALIALLSAVVIAVQAASRIPSPARDLAEIREQLSHIAGMLREREPHADEDEARELAINVARLQQTSAQSQQDLSQLQEMLRQVMGKLDSLRSVATAPSPAAAALDREADEADTFTLAPEEEPVRLPDDEPLRLPDGEPTPIVSTKPRFEFRPTPPADDTLVEHFVTLDAARSRVDDLMALSNWDQAMAIATKFADDHDDDADAQWLRQRVEREFDIYREGSVRRLYEQIKDELERRHYRTFVM